MSVQRPCEDFSLPEIKKGLGRENQAPGDVPLKNPLFQQHHPFNPQKSLNS